jgi:hypothetical protein
MNAGRLRWRSTDADERKRLRIPLGLPIFIEKLRENAAFSLLYITRYEMVTVLRD